MQLLRNSNCEIIVYKQRNEENPLQMIEKIFMRK